MVQLDCDRGPIGEMVSISDQDLCEEHLLHIKLIMNQLTLTKSKQAQSVERGAACLKNDSFENKKEEKCSQLTPQRHSLV